MAAQSLFDDRDQFVHYIHTWDMPGYEDLQHVLSISDVEEMLKDRLVAIAALVKQKGNENEELFYHDHSNGGVRVKLESRDQFGEGREGLLRVIGCGHLLLGIKLFHGQQQEQTIETWNLVNSWRVLRQEWLGEDGSLHPDTVCDPVNGSSQHLQAFFNTITDYVISSLPPKELEIIVNRFGTTYSCRHRCLYTEEETEQYPAEYREMIYLHMLEGIVSAARVEGEALGQQFAFLTRKNNAPVLPVEREIFSFSMLASMVVDARSWVQNSKLRNAKKKTAAGYSSEEHQTSTESSSTYSKQQSSSSKQTRSAFSHRNVTSGAGGTRIVHSTGASSSYTMQNWIREVSTQSHTTYKWSRYVNVRNTTWTPARSGAAAFKVVGEYWKLGCKGCPKAVQVQKRVTSSGRRRTCKWVTIKRAVLVKRPARRA